MTLSFSTHGLPGLVFERGATQKLSDYCAPYGKAVLIVADKSFEADHPLMAQLRQKGFEVILYSDDISARWDMVVSIGSARAIDQAKRLSQGCFHISIPTTVGIGAAMNGVMFDGSRLPAEDNNLQHVPDLVIADADFIDGMARDDFAMRAIGTLMLLSDAYISQRASVLSDALVWSGLEKFAQGFLNGVEGDPVGREQVFFASLMAGAGTGLVGFGLTHYLAATLEQQSPLRYAQISASLSAEMTDLQINQLADCLPDDPANDKYAMIGELLAGRPFDVREEAYASLVGTLRRWVARLELPKIETRRTDMGDIMKDVLDQTERTVLPPIIGFDDLGRALERRCLFVA